MSRLVSAGRQLAARVALLSLLPVTLPFTPGTGTGAIAGRVTDLAGAPVRSARVIVVGTTISGLTDPRGGYRLEKVPEGSWVLRVSSAGYKRTEATVTVTAGATTRHYVSLEPSPAMVDEVAVVVRPDAKGQVAAPRTETTARQLFLPKSVARTSQPLPGFDTEDYRYFRDNGFKSSSVDPLSTFAIDVDAASYANVRRFLTQGQRPPADAVRIEELINYFTYDYEQPRGGDPFAVTTAQMPAPWAPAHQLVMIGLQGRRVDVRELPASNLVFLIDVSGSMGTPDKLPLVQRAFRLLVDQLRPQDRVAIVVYAGAAGLVLPSTSGADKATILGALDALHAGGSTAGGAGIRLAYDIAKQHHIEGGNNRVILATDGDFNVGVSSEGELTRLVEERKRQGTWLTVLGFGTGNLKDSRMETLADKGNGHYAYVDDILEARKVLVQELGATLLTIARDVKIQVEFNPSQVAEYRLIGYENRMLEHQDFNDDAKDGGELGAGHNVTAIYEVVPVGVRRSGAGSVDDLKYQRPADRSPSAGDELATIKLRYQPPTGDGPSRLITRTVRKDAHASGTESLRFAAAVAQYGMLLRNSEFKGSSSWDGVLSLARSNMGRDAGGYRAEFVRLVEVAKGLGPVPEVGLAE